MGKEINYEVLVEQNGRWSIHARFGGHEKEPAIDEGRQLDKLPSVDSVKVIKEVYDTERDIHSEFIVFKSSDMKMAGRGKSGNKDKSTNKSSDSRSGGSDNRFEGSAGDDWDDDSDSPESGGGGKKKKKKKNKNKKNTTTLTNIIVKLLMVVLFSVTIGSGAAMVVDGMIGGTRMFGVHFVGNAQSNLLIGVFTLTFLICTVGLAVKVMSGSKLADSRQRGADARFAKLVKRAQQERAQKSTKKKGEKPKAPKMPPDDFKAKSEEDAKKTQENLNEAMKGVDDFQVEQSTEPKPEDPEAKTSENEATTDRLQSELNKDKPPEDETTKRGVVLDAETHGKTPAAPDGGLSPEEEKQKAYMLEFLKGALEGDQTDLAKMDNFNKFGVNLYLAGACEILSQKRGVSVNARSKILADGVQVMGFKKSHAASFADKYEEYLMADAHYMQMFQAGRNAMNIHSTDEGSASRLLDNAMTEWNKPKPKEEQTGPVTVLFTDIAGSTAMTQAMGDAGAQKVVRAHNRVVREALSAHAGKEVKHTGDGIMASFAKTSDAVSGAIQMQLETMKHNIAEPDLPLHLKIGLNSGEPIAEDNDLFGTVVQLSARIVDKASADEIYVSEIVRGICAGKSYKFKNLGGFPMKGFGDDVILFEVIWDEAQEEKSA